MINPNKMDSDELIMKKMDKVFTGTTNRNAIFNNMLSYMFDSSKNAEDIKRQTAGMISRDDIFSRSFAIITMDEVRTIMDILSNNIQNCMVIPGDELYCVLPDENKKFYVEKCEVSMITQTKERIVYHMSTLGKKERKTFLADSDRFYKSIFFNKKDAKAAIKRFDEIESLLGDCN